MRLFSNTKIDFLGSRRLAYWVSAAIIIPGLVLIPALGINYSVEFTGGTQVQIRTVEPGDVALMRQALMDKGVASAEIIQAGVDTEFIIRARVGVAGSDADNTQATVQAVTAALDAAIGSDGWSVREAAAVSPKVGGELRQKAFFAILLSFVAVLFYLWYRFEWRFGGAAVAATIHDILATVAFIAMFRIEVSLFVVGALLSVVGYSLNDTIVIFDRVRENLRRSKREDFVGILNTSINETLPRTALTSGTSFAVLLTLATLGGDVVRPFALVMLFGVVVGTYSSIFIASPVLLGIERRWPGAQVRGVKSPALGTSTKRKRPQPVG
ncbi:MAG: protein translocase subunit SecF [Gemmatimonadales bacterium]